MTDKIKRLTPEVQAELSRIQSSIPKELTDKLVYRGNPSQEMLDVLYKIVADPEASTQQKYKAQLMIDAETFLKEEDMVDKKIEAQINQYIDEEIAKSVKRGTLPKGKKFRNLKDKIKKEKL